MDLNINNIKKYIHIVNPQGFHMEYEVLNTPNTDTYFLYLGNKKFNSLTLKKYECFFDLKKQVDEKYDLLRAEYINDLNNIKDSPNYIIKKRNLIIQYTKLLKLLDQEIDS